MPRVKLVEYNLAGPDWLLEGKARDHSQTGIYDPADFSAVVSKYGCIPSGYPVKFDDKGSVRPIAAETDVPEGLIVWSQSGRAGAGKQDVAVLTHGVVWHKRLPKVVVSGGEAKTLAVSDKNATPIVYLYKESE